MEIVCGVEKLIMLFGMKILASLLNSEYTYITETGSRVCGVSSILKRETTQIKVKDHKYSLNVLN